MFTQRRLLTSFSFVLEPDGVAVTEKRLTSSRSYHVPFERLPHTPSYASTSSGPRLLLAGILALASIFTGVVIVRGGDAEREAPWIWGALAIAAGLWYWESRRSYVVLGEGPSALVLFRSRPTTSAVDAFVTELLRWRADYLTRHYGQRADSPVDRVDRLAQLRAEGLLSDEEYSRLKAQVLATVNLKDMPTTLH